MPTILTRIIEYRHRSRREKQPHFGQTIVRQAKEMPMPGHARTIY